MESDKAELSRRAAIALRRIKAARELNPMLRVAVVNEDGELLDEDGKDDMRLDIEKSILDEERGQP